MKKKKKKAGTLPHGLQPTGRETITPRRVHLPLGDARPGPTCAPTLRGSSPCPPDHTAGRPRGEQPLLSVKGVFLGDGGGASGPRPSHRGSSSRVVVARPTTGAPLPCRTSACSSSSTPGTAPPPWDPRSTPAPAAAVAGESTAGSGFVAHPACPSEEEGAVPGAREVTEIAYSGPEQTMAKQLVPSRLGSACSASRKVAPYPASQFPSPEKINSLQEETQECGANHGCPSNLKAPPGIPRC